MRRKGRKHGQDRARTMSTWKPSLAAQRIRETTDARKNLEPTMPESWKPIEAQMPARWKTSAAIANSAATSKRAPMMIEGNGNGFLFNLMDLAERAME